jgi:uncharacterized protein (UPF0276 family)
MTLSRLTSLHGTGLGLRSCHFDYILRQQPNVPWFEALSDNYFHDAMHRQSLRNIAEHYPITFHGVGMSLGSTDPLNLEYLNDLKQLANEIQPILISDHLSWSSVNYQYLHDLLPLPFTQETLLHVADRICQVQDILGCPIMIENASSYLQFKYNEMQEWEFINALTQRTGCYVLLDVNNIYVSAYNLGFDPVQYIDQINQNSVKQFHLAGYSNENTYLFDMHNQTIHDPVWSLFKIALQRFGSLPTLIERDDNIPEFELLYQEAQIADSIMHDIEKQNAYTA